MRKTLTEQALACASWHEAQNVIDQLFSKSLILRAEILPVQKGVEQVMVVMENLESDLESIKRELAEFFGGDNYKLQAIPR